MTERTNLELLLANTRAAELPADAARRYVEALQTVPGGETGFWRQLHDAIRQRWGAVWLDWIRTDAFDQCSPALVERHAREYRSFLLEVEGRAGQDSDRCDDELPQHGSEV